MGNARWDPNAYASYTRSTANKSQQQIFAQHGLHADLDPAKIKVREAVDSPANPASTPIILAVDETGSMGYLAEQIIRKGLGTIMDALYKHRPVSDPAICCMGLGDAYVDEAPLQVTQFESSSEPLVKQVEQIFLEGHGGGNGGESYALAWWFATYKTICDAITKRQRKGYLFTIGDECCHPVLTRDQVKKILGVGCEVDIPVKQLLDQTQQFWNVFHLIVAPQATQPVVQTWKGLLNERAIMVSDPTKLDEIIVALIRMNEGASVDDVTRGHAAGTAVVIRDVHRQLATV